MSKKTNLGEATSTRKHSVNLSEDVSNRLRRLAFENTISEAAIVEHSVRLFFATGDDKKLVAVLRDAGAKGRRIITGGG